MPPTIGRLGGADPRGGSEPPDPRESTNLGRPARRPGYQQAGDDMPDGREVPKKKKK